MTKEEAILLIKSAQLMLVNPKTNEPISDLYEALDMAIKALEQEPCDDCVSRQEVEELLRCGCAYDIWNLPSVIPKHEQGEWILEEVGVRTQVLKCSKCGTIIQRGENFTQEEFRKYINDILREKCITLNNFCHNCGAKMTESEE